MRFSASSVQVILLNPIYKGLISSNASGEYQEKRGVHEPLVSDELWAKVQAVKASREYGMKKATIDHKPHLLGGLVYCTECMQGEPPTDIAIERWGKMFMNRGRKPRKDGSLYKLSYYQCDAHHQAIHMEKLEDQIVAFLTDENLSHLWANEAQKIVAVGIETEDIEARIKEIEGIMSRMNEAYFKGFITDVQKWEQDQATLKIELDSLRPTRDDAYEKSIDLVHNFSKHWKQVEGDIEAQRRLKQLGKTA